MRPSGLSGAPTAVRAGLYGGSAVLALWTLRAAGGWGSDRIDRLVTDWVFPALFVPAIAVCATRALRVRRERAAWLLFSLALISTTGGWPLYALFVRGLASPPSPSIADLSWLAYYPFAFAGLVMLVKSRLGGLDRTLLLDGLIGALAVAAVAAAVLLAPLAARTGGSDAAVATALAYPLGDLHMAAIVIAIFGLLRWRPGWSWSLLGLGFLVAAAGDSVYLFQASSGTWAPGTALDATWPTMALLLAVSGWLPARRTAVASLGSWSSLVPALAFAVLAIGLVVYASFRDLGDAATGLAIATLVASQIRTVDTFVTLRRLDRRAIEGPAEVLMSALTARDNYTADHSETVVKLAASVARRLGLSKADTLAVEQVALLHDVGKIGIPDSVLQKRGGLDEADWELMRQHPVIGAKIVAGTDSLAHLAPKVRAEHERWDGGGYPDGLSGDQIPLESRIVLACDAYHAMTSDRPYRAALPVSEAILELERHGGSQFDPAVVTALTQEIRQAQAHEPDAVTHDRHARQQGQRPTSVVGRSSSLDPRISRVPERSVAADR